MIVLFALPEENGYKERHVLIHKRTKYIEREKGKGLLFLDFVEVDMMILIQIV